MWSFNFFLWAKWQLALGPEIDMAEDSWYEGTCSAARNSPGSRTTGAEGACATALGRKDLLLRESAEAQKHRQMYNEDLAPRLHTLLIILLPLISPYYNRERTFPLLRGVDE